MIRFLIAIVAGLSLLCSCTSRGARALPQGGDTLTHRAGLLTMVDYGDYVVASVGNPWTADSTAELQRYVLVAKDYSGPLPQGAVRVNVPLERSVVYSGVHGGTVEELNGIGQIAAVADGQYFSSDAIRHGIADGTIADVGNSAAPSVERMVSMSPDAILLSPYQNQEIGAVARLGVPVVQCVDYMEQTPLGRAEWIKLLGVLYGKRREADSIYNKVCADYDSLCRMANAVADHPKVLTEMPMGGAWTVPGGRSYMARMIADAGGVYPWGGTDEAGSLKLDVSNVFDKAADADVWVVRVYGPLTRGDLEGTHPLLKRFKALSTGRVWVCDSSRSPLYDEFPFHPERLLSDYIAIFHPELNATPIRYFNVIDNR